MIDNMLDAATELEINPSFVRIPFLEPLISLKSTVVKDLYKSGLWLQDNLSHNNRCISNYSGFIRNLSCKPLSVINNCK